MAGVNDPVLESEVKAAYTFLKLADAVLPKMAAIGGGFSTEILRHRVGVVQRLKRNAAPVEPPLDFGNNERVATREEAIARLKICMSEDADKFNKAFGFYCAMAEYGDVRDDGLRHAYALKKLRRNNVGHFINGVEAFKDYRAAKARERAQRPPAPPSRPSGETVR